MNIISENLDNVKKRIKEASDRSPYGQDVTLIAVSKTKPVSMIQEAYDAGIRDFGENKVQELTDKYDKLPSDIRWHLIGHLQRNKVKYIVDKVYMIHSVDSLRLAEEIEKQAEKKGVTVKILVEVNISHEESKFGIDRAQTEELLRAIALMKHLEFCGFMTVAPAVENPEEVRGVFRELKNLSIDIEGLNIDNIHISVLSMGMSGDFQVAVEEGSNMVRVGTSIFGARDYSI